MAMDRGNEHEEGVIVEEEFGSSCQTSPQDKRELIRELIGVIHTVGSYEEYRKSQIEECHNLVNRLKLLLPILNEIRDFEGQIPELGIECLVKLKKALSSAKKLLKTCHCGSKIYLALESESVIGRFHSVYERLSQALEGMPYDELGISDEEKEQVELLSAQFRRAKKRTDTQDMELCMDLMVALSTNNDRNADSASIDRLGHKLGLHNIQEVKAETVSVRKVVKERKGRHEESTRNIIYLLNKFRRFVGLEETDPLMPKVQEEKFSCPFTEKPESQPVEDDGKLLSLIQDLSSNQLEVQREAVKQIRMLSKESPEMRTLIVNGGGISPIVHLLSYPDSRIQEHAVTTILNLSIDETNKKLISEQESIPAIIDILQNGDVGAKENSAAALFSLSMLDENKVAIGSLNGIPPLIDLLTNGTIRGKKDAMTALFNLCLNEQNVSLATKGGIVAPLFELLEDKALDMVDEALSILLLVATHSEGRQEIFKLSFVETLVNLIRDGSTPKNKECSVAVLHRLCVHNSNLMLAALQYGVYEHLVEISENGTDRGQRKAKSILQLMSKTGQIP